MPRVHVERRQHQRCFSVSSEPGTEFSFNKTPGISERAARHLNDLAALNLVLTRNCALRTIFDPDCVSKPGILRYPLLFGPTGCSQDARCPKDDTSMNDPSAALDPTALYIPRHHDPRFAAEPAFSRRDEPTKTFDDLAAESRALSEQFEGLVQRDRISWEVEYRLVKKLGSGGQGVVFLADRQGAFGSTFRLALKFFHPDGYSDAEIYREEMSRLARLAMRLAHPAGPPPRRV